MSAIVPMEWDRFRATHAHGILAQPLFDVVDRLKPARAFDLGCGNGFLAVEVAARGPQVVGVDPSEEGVALARSHASDRARFEVGSADDDLAARFGRFPLVYSLEVVEHVYSPRRYVQTLHDLVEPGGHALLSTPFHGYWKNLAIALTNGFDRHVNPLWEGGHIKFWSEATLAKLLEQAGFRDLRFWRVGRIKPLAKSMMVLARRPS